MVTQVITDVTAPRRTRTTHEQVITEKNLAYRDNTETSLHHCIRRVREATAYWRLCPLPNRSNTTWKGFLWTPSSSKKKREHKGTISTTTPLAQQITSWEPLLWSCPVRTAEETMGFNHWEFDRDGEGGVACNNQHTDLDRWNSWPQCPKWVVIQVVAPTSSFAHHQNQVCNKLGPEN